MAASSLTILSSSGLLSKSLHRPIVYSLLHPFAFFAYRYFKSNPHHLCPVCFAYRSLNTNAMPAPPPPLLRPVVASSSFAAYRFFNTKAVADRLSHCSLAQIDMYPHSLSSLTVSSAGHISKSLFLPIVFSLLRSIALSSLTASSVGLISKSFLCPIILSSLTISSPGLISKSYLHTTRKLEYSDQKFPRNNGFLLKLRISEELFPRYTHVRISAFPSCKLSVARFS